MQEVTKNVTCVAQYEAVYKAPSELKMQAFKDAVDAVEESTSLMKKRATILAVINAYNGLLEGEQVCVQVEYQGLLLYVNNYNEVVRVLMGEYSVALSAKAEIRK